VTLVELLGNWVSTELERQRRQRELETSNERLEQFAYVASHDLQEPLRMVSSYLQLIERRYVDDLDEDGREFLDYAVDGADRMRAMIEGLLEYSRVETQGDPFEPVDLDDVLADILDDLKLQIAKSDAAVEGGVVADRRGRRRPVAPGVPESPLERHQLQRRRPTGDRGVGRAARERVGAVRPGPRDRYRCRRFRPYLRRLRQAAHARRTARYRHRTGPLSEDNRSPRWRDMGRLRPGEGSTFSFSLPAVDPA